MSNNIQDKEFHKRYNINEYINIRPYYNQPNEYNIVYLRNHWCHKVSILNLKAFKLRCDYLETWKSGNYTNIDRLRKICSEAVANPPVKTKGIAIATKKFEELMSLLDEYKKNLQKLDTSSMISKAKAIREKNINETINELEKYIQWEEQERQNNLEDSKKGFVDYWSGNV